jgi:hypothetical protein
MQKLSLSLLLLTLSSPSFARQIKLERVEQMADLPRPYKIIDYQDLSKRFDKTVFDFKAKGDLWPLIWIDNNQDNFKAPTFGIFTAMGDSRQGPHVNETYHESLNSMGAILGATLVGVDKSNQDGMNYVSMMKNYFNKDTGWNIMQNNTNPKAGALGGGYGRDWWYDVFPNLLFYAIYDKYPQEKGFEGMARSIADKFYEADKILEGDYNFSFFDYGAMKPVKNWICAQPDVAAGHSWVLYSAYKKFGDPKYLAGAKSALNALASNRINPSYEVLMPFGAYMAARLNAQEGTNYDVTKMLDWTFDGTAVCRKGWGVLADNWNGYDVSGLMGSTVDHGGYGFLMNTYDMAWPLLPMVRYDQSYATSIGKWMLNAANAARFMYPEHLPTSHQTVPELAYITKGVIAYEGLIKKSSHPEFTHVLSPVAQGDGPKWTKENPEASQFSVYGSAHVGFFGSTVRHTNVEGILQLDLLATDFFKDPAYPTHLYYNPHRLSRWVEVDVGHKSSDLYDAVSAKFVGFTILGKTFVKVPGKGSVVLVQTPANGKKTYDGGKLLVNGIVIDYKLHKPIFGEP